MTLTSKDHMMGTQANKGYAPHQCKELFMLPPTMIDMNLWAHCGCRLHMGDLHCSAAHLCL